MKVEKILNYLQELSVGRPPASVGPNSNCTRKENMGMFVELACIDFEVFEKNRYLGFLRVKSRSNTFIVREHINN